MLFEDFSSVAKAREQIDIRHVRESKYSPRREKASGEVEENALEVEIFRSSLHKDSRVNFLST